MRTHTSAHILRERNLCLRFNLFVISGMRLSRPLRRLHHSVSGVAILHDDDELRARAALMKHLNGRAQRAHSTAHNYRRPDSLAAAATATAAAAKVFCGDKLQRQRQQTTCSASMTNGMPSRVIGARDDVPIIILPVQLSARRVRF